MIRFSEAAWSAILAQTTAAGRAQALATLNPTTIEFLDAAATVIRTVTTGTWTVSGANAVPGSYTDAGTGAGTPTTAVFKASGTEVMRMSCGTLAGSDYLLLANIVASVKIRRGSFAITFLDPPGAGTSEPAATVAPVISGTAQVGQTLTAFAGTWTGNPVPTITRQWYRGASAISGATGLFYTLVSADAGAIISLVETGTNTVGSATSASNTLGPVTDGALDASAVPNPINLDQGGTFDFTPYISGGVPPYTVAVASGSSLPAEVTLTNNVLTASGSATVALSGDIVFDVDDSAVAATLPTFGLLSSVGGTDLPFTFGHVFKQGDVPSGSYVDSDLTDWQCVPTTTWPDGSLRHAIIAGRATCTQNVRKDITLEVSATDRTGTALTEANLASVLPTVTIQGGAHTTTLNSLVGTAAKHRTVCAGPIMSNWIYRHAVTSSNHLVVWIDVRLYKGGRVEIFPWVENAYLTVANPTNDVRTWTVTIGGTQVFSQSIDIKHHTRIPLISGSTFSYWTADPGIVPVHDTDYMMASKMVPNYGWTSPGSATLDALQQSYTPNTLAGISSNMGTAGSSAAILNLAHALYCTTGDQRAFKAAIVFGLSGGSWSIHYRDNEFSNEPFAFADRPNISTNMGGSPSVPTGTGGDNGSASRTHQPSYGYLPWLITGRWWFLDESLFWSGYNYIGGTPGQRRGEAFGQDTGTYPAYAASAEAGIFDTTNGTYTHRGAAWCLRTLAQSLAIVPAGHPCFASLKASMEYNVGFYNDLYITGSYERNASSASYVGNVLGYMGHYTNYMTPPSLGFEGWQKGMFNQVLGFIADLDLPQTTSTELDAVVTFSMKWHIGTAGDATGWDHRWFTTYGAYIGTTSALSASFADAFAGHVSTYSLNTAVVDDDLRQHSSNSDLTAGEDSSWPYWGQAYASLSYAVERGVIGAETARSRIIGATNYNVVTTAFNNDPVYGIVPRSA